MSLTIWHNPRCSKSRQTLALLEDSNRPVTVRNYLQDAPSRAELEAAAHALGLAPQHFIRTGEKRYKELDLKGADDATLFAAMAANPILIERPIVFHAGRAIIGRPPDNVKTLL